MDKGESGADDLSRREFAAVSTAAAVAVGAGAAEAAPMQMEMVIRTADGDCDVALTHPVGKGKWPAVLVWPDAFGLRPVFREMAQRLSAEGFVVLTVNQFYRTRKAPPFDGPVVFDEAARARLGELRKPLTPEAVMRDATAFIAWLDKLPMVNAKAKVGVVGYCMGGAMTVQTAAAAPGRVGAGCSFHGGGLVTARPDSPHLLAPKVKAAYHFGVARDDDAKEPLVKDQLRQALDAAKVKATIEVYAADHGWCTLDSPVYNQPEADRAWGRMLELFGKL